MSQINFQEIRSSFKCGSGVVFDVRNPNELREDGKMEGCHNIPLKCHNIPLPELNSALQMDAGKFKLKYGFEMPKQTDDVIISCRPGKRGYIAKSQLEEQGFKNIKVYEDKSSCWNNKEKSYWC